MSCLWRGPCPLRCCHRKESQSYFLQCVSELTQSVKEDDHVEVRNLYDDFQAAQGRIWSESVAKLSYFHQLRLWNENSPGKWHMQSRRFLEPGFPNGFRKLVERLAAGQPIWDDTMQPLRAYLARISCLRIAERTVEGVHSVVTRVYKRAPRASLPYISLELRFKDFCQAVTNEPTVAERGALKFSVVRSQLSVVIPFGWCLLCLP